MCNFYIGGNVIFAFWGRVIFTSGECSFYPKIEGSVKIARVSVKIARVSVKFTLG